MATNSNLYTPCNSKKVPFYNSLVAFFDGVKDTIVDNNTFISPQIESLFYEISYFLNDKKWLNPTPYVPQVLDKDIVNINRPIRKDKVALYNRLVEFMDAFLIAMKDSKNETKSKEVYNVVSKAYECLNNGGETIFALIGVSRETLEETFEPSFQVTHPLRIYFIAPHFSDNHIRKLNEKEIARIAHKVIYSLADLEDEFNKALISDEDYMRIFTD